MARRDRRKDFPVLRNSRSSYVKCNDNNDDIHNGEAIKAGAGEGAGAGAIRIKAGAGVGVLLRFCYLLHMISSICKSMNC